LIQQDAVRIMADSAANLSIGKAPMPPDSALGIFVLQRNQSRFGDEIGGDARLIPRL
jgi:hypothetical protein